MPDVAVTSRKDHRARAKMLREVLAAFPKGAEASAADQVIRRRLEGAVIAEELAAGEPGPRHAESGAHRPIRIRRPIPDDESKDQQG